MKKHFSKDNMFQCKICQKIFNHRNSLKIHSITHTKVKPYDCDLCNKSFTQKVNMITHRKLHFGELKFTCDICDKKFSQKGNMLSHKKYHTGEKPFECDFCKRSFFEKFYMIRHRQSHSDMPNYTELQYKKLDSFSCEICHKYFNSKGNYLKHKAKHFNKRAISKLRHNSKENIDKTTARTANKTQFNTLQHSESNVLKLKYQEVKQVSVNIEKLNIENIFNVWGINVINQYDDIINQDASNQSMTIRSDINIEVTDTTFIMPKGELSEEDIKHEKIPSKICIPITCKKVENEEITLPELSNFLSEESKVSNAVSGALEFDKYNKSMEKTVINEEDVSQVQEFSDFDIKPELEENLNQDSVDNLEENAKVDTMNAIEFLQLDIVCDTNANDLDDKESEIEIDELLDGDDEDIYNSSNSEVPDILDEELFQNLDSSLHQVFFPILETEQHKDELLNEEVSAKGLDSIDSALEDQPGLDGSQKSCPYCALIFSNQRNLDFHMQTMHSKGKPHFCNICNKSFTRQYNLLKHNQRIHSDNRKNSQKSCPYCALIFSTQRNLDLHMQAIHPTEKPHFCERCNKSFTRQKSLLRHNRRVHSENRENSKKSCPYCALIFSTQRNLDLHMQAIHSTEKPHFCDRCHKSFTRQESLLIHNQRVHSDNGENSNTENKITDQYNLSSKANFYDTFKKSKRSEVKTCADELKKESICNDSLFNQMTSENGEEKIDYVQPKKGNICSLCGIGFTRKYSLKKHIMKTHKDEKFYACDLCNETYSENVKLNRHKSLKHWHEKAGRRVYTCEECGNSFKKENSMRKHLESHLIIECSICGKRFSRKNYLISHIRTHTGEKPYSCDICGLSFAVNSNMHTHKRKQHGQTTNHHSSPCDKRTQNNQKYKVNNLKIKKEDSTYSCDICSKSFTDLGDCLEHEKTHFKSYSKRSSTSCDLNEDDIKKEVEEDCSLFKTVSSEDQDVKMETEDVIKTESIIEEDCSLIKTVEAKGVPILEAVDLSKENPKQKKPKKNVQTLKTIIGKKVNKRDEKSYSCKFCKEIFDEKKELLNHKISHLERGQSQNNFSSLNNGVPDVDSVSSAENELVYKCAMESCESKMCLNDMKNGRAVQHMITSHQIYPYRMVKLGLSWIKTSS